MSSRRLTVMSHLLRQLVCVKRPDQSAVSLWSAQGLCETWQIRTASPRLSTILTIHICPTATLPELLSPSLCLPSPAPRSASLARVRGFTAWACSAAQCHRAAIGGTRRPGSVWWGAVQPAEAAAAAISRRPLMPSALTLPWAPSHPSLTGGLCGGQQS